MPSAYWQLVAPRGGYYVWHSTDGTYQVTRTKTPPDTTAGYHNLDSLLRLKGILK